MLPLDPSLLRASVPSALICSDFLAGPWFFKFNYRLLALMVRWFPLTDARMNLAEFFIQNHLVSGWVFAAATYYFWSLRDERTAWRRARIIEAAVACVAAVLLTLAFRPFIGAPSPTFVPEFQQLFPPYLWDFGSGNSLPSHSTLVYFVVAAGLWPIHRKCSAILCGWVLVSVSLPRIYIGGHYPTDVLASVVIGAAVLWAAWRVGESRWGSKLLDRVVGVGPGGGGLWIELAMFLWLFEIGEAFRSGGEIAMLLARRILRF